MTPRPVTGPYRFAVVVVMALSVVVASCSDASDPDTTTSTTTTEAARPPRPVSAELVAITSIDEGDCFDTHVEESSPIRAVWLIPCAELHDYEVYASFDYEGDDVQYRHPAYPGQSIVQDQAERRCYDLFESFVGARWTISELDIRTWWPSEASWTDADRRILCAVTPTDRAGMVGSQRGSAR